VTLRDVTACTGQAQHGRYQCPQSHHCERYTSWLEASVRDGLLTMGATQQEPCPYYVPVKAK
jgi:hypothetical protein